MKFRQQGITQKKEYNIHNTVTVSNQKCKEFFTYQ